MNQQPPQQPQQPPMPPQQPQQSPVQPYYQQPQQPPMPQPQQSPVQPYYQQPQPQPVAPPTAEGKHKVHHSYIWASGIQVTIALFIVFAVSILPMIMFEDIPVFGIALIIGGSILGILAIIGLTIGLQALAYKHLYYEIGPKEFTLYSGIFNKKQVHVPYQRVQSVNQRATLVQRILGVCTVNIDTAGGAANKAVVVPYIRNSEAEFLRSELFARKQFILSGGQSAQSQVTPQPQVPGQPQGANVLDAPAEIMTDIRGVFGGSQVYTGQVSYEYGLSNKELILTGLSNNTGFVLMILALISGVFGIVSQVISTEIGEQVVNESVSYLTHLFADRLIWFLVIAFLGGILVLWVLSIIGTCFTYGGFKASRRDNRIEVQQGLLQHHFHGVDIDRVQSVIIKQTFIRRLMGYCELSLGKIDAAVDGSQEQEQSIKINQGLIIHPFVKMDRVPEILAGLVPEFSDVPTEPIKLPSVSLRRAIIRRGILYGNGLWLAVIATIFMVICNSIPEVAYELGSSLEVLNLILIGVYAVCAVIAAIEVINAVLWFRGSSFAYNQQFMQVSNGGFSRESITFPRKKIQFAFTRSNPFQRRAKVATINARTAAGIGGTTMKLLDVSENDADALLEWVKPRQGMVK